MEERGWDVNPNYEEHSIGADIPDEQVSVFDQDTDDCSAASQPAFNDYSDAQWAAWYAIVVKSAECLQGQGYEVGEVPSLQLFISGDGNWSPFDELVIDGTLTGAALSEVEQICPQPEYWPGS